MGIEIHKTPFKAQHRCDGDGSHWYVVDRKGLMVANCGPSCFGQEVAERFAAMWNAFEGVPTEGIKRQGRTDG